MCHNYALASSPPWLKPLPRLLSPFCCSWAPNDDVTAILPVVFSYHTLESLYVIGHVTVCSFKLVKGSIILCMVLELAFELSTRWDVILRMLSA